VRIDRREAAGLEIKKAKLRGVESNGMLCSARELGLSQDHAGLLVLEDDAPIGRDIREHLDLDDVYLTLKLTPNRGDCLSMFGIARDVAAITGRRCGCREAKAVAADDSRTRARSRSPSARVAASTTAASSRESTPRARTPAWMVRRLERAGLRCISPLVDITNYVMLERGQPMHAFDHAKLQGRDRRALHEARRRAEAPERAGIEFIPNLLAITDASGPVAFGGVMGGYDTMVTSPRRTCSSRRRTSTPRLSRAARARSRS
jgi:phenylalanyl-tRNA synthetase beta chain